MQRDTPIGNVSDTARWVAFYRALESERDDALFHDPFARRLAGSQGEAISRSMPQSRHVDRAVVTRTVVIDRWIREAVERRGVTLIVNLAAGLDSRPWRMQLPASLRWVDVDLPGILDYKLDILRSDTPVCQYEAIRADLSDAVAAGSVLADLGRGGDIALVLTEGLLIYLEPEHVTALARALHQQPGFRWWISDLASPLLLEFVSRSRGAPMRNAPFRFAPPEGTEFFRRYGWSEDRFVPTSDEARRIGRPMPRDWLMRVLGRFASAQRRELFRRMSGIVLLERSGAGLT